jgi:RHS repeat-associated protein
VTGGAVKKYYSFAGQSIALRDATGLQYFLRDHLGSVLAVLGEDGTLIGEQRYLPFGEVRADVGSITQTDFGYTGQRYVAGLDLMDYHARFYSSSLGRFVQPDTIIPGAANPQSWNRYSYVSNNSIRYNDPTGHRACDDDVDRCLGNSYKTYTLVVPPPPPWLPGRPHVKRGDGTTISATPQPTFAEKIAQLKEYASYMNNAVDAVRGMLTAETLLKKGFLWAKAINPNPGIDLLLGVAGQTISDLKYDDLTGEQRAKRAGVVGLESMVTGVAADVAGAGGFWLGELIVPSGGGVFGYGGASLAASIYLDEHIWQDYNQSNFEGWGLGVNP